MKTWLKQLFCRHIWESTEARIIGEGTQFLLESIPYKRYKRYVVTWGCVKCDRSKITEEKTYHDLF